MSAEPENIEQTPSPIVAALQREHPEWIGDVIYAFGRRRSSFHESISSPRVPF